MTAFQKDIDQLVEEIATNKITNKELKAHLRFFEKLQLYDVPEDALAAPHEIGGVAFWSDEDGELTILSVVKGEPEHFIGLNIEDVELVRDLCNTILNSSAETVPEPAATKEPRAKTSNTVVVAYNAAGERAHVFASGAEAARYFSDDGGDNSRSHVNTAIREGGFAYGYTWKREAI